MSSRSKVLQVLMRVLVMVGLLGAAAGNKHGELGRREKQFHLNYVTRRRIPNGPDPIHNRRTGSSRQPPGQA